MQNRGFCVINERTPRKFCHGNSQFIQRLTHEDLHNRAVRAQEVLLSFENPMIREQKLQNQICVEVAKLDRKTILEEKRKAMLHKNVEEIRILDTQLIRADIQRQLVEQKALNDKKLKENIQRRFQESKRFEEDLKHIREIALKEERERVQKQIAFRQGILKQIQEKDEAIKREKINIAKEHESRQKLSESVEEDVRKEEEFRLKLREELRQERSKYQKELDKSQSEVDIKKDIRDYEEMCRQREEAKRVRNEKRKQALQERADLSERIGQQLYKIEKEKQKRHEVLLELLYEERLAKDEERFKTKLESHVLRGKVIRDDFKRYFACKEKDILLKREDEKKVLKEELELFQQLKQRDVEIKNLTSSRNRQHRQELLNAVEYKKAMRDLEALQNKKEYEQLLALQKKHRQEIETEKLRLLQSVPIEILKFVPRNSISAEHRASLGFASVINK